MANPERDWKISDMNEEAPKVGAEDIGQFHSESCPFCDIDEPMEAHYNFQSIGRHNPDIWYYECDEERGCGTKVWVETPVTIVIAIETEPETRANPFSPPN